MVYRKPTVLATSLHKLLGERDIQFPLFLNAEKMKERYFLEEYKVARSVTHMQYTRHLVPDVSVSYLPESKTTSNLRGSPIIRF